MLNKGTKASPPAAYTQWQSQKHKNKHKVFSSSHYRYTDVMDVCYAVVQQHTKFNSKRLESCVMTRQSLYYAGNCHVGHPHT